MALDQPGLFLHRHRRIGPISVLVVAILGLLAMAARCIPRNTGYLYIQEAKKE
jgi:hypothetical protein